MPKVKTISRNEEDFTRERSQDLTKVYRNADPVLHPFERAREYTRALNATKWDKVFAKPFLGALDGHRDGIWCMSTVPTSLTQLVSGACDGEMKVWHLGTRKNVWSARAHKGFVRSVSVDPTASLIVSCSEDSTVKVWDLDQSPALEARLDITPAKSFLGANGLNGVDWSYSAKSGQFVSCGASVQLWHVDRAEPVHSFSWGAESIFTVKFNRVELDVVAATASDRALVLYDIRQKTPIRKLLMVNNSNAMCWNPMEAYNFTLASEDRNLYTFDMRKLDRATKIHEDHVSAVMSVDYSPTGSEVVSGSYDRTIRIFPIDDGHSREVYHTKRMQRVFSVKYSADNKYILSGSDDTNIRLWKAQAAKPLRFTGAREQHKLQYEEKLKERFQHVPELRRIARAKHVPKYIVSARKRTHISRTSERRKQENRKAHSKPGQVPDPPAKRKRIVRVLE